MKKIFLVLVLFLFSCNNDYTEFHNKKIEETQKNTNIEKALNNFSFDDIKYLSWITLKETPDTKFLDELVEKINNSQEKVYVEVYIFTEKRLRTAIKKAYDRWVQVKVLLEKNVYKASYLNNDTFKYFKNAWIDVRYSNAENYSLNHTKMMIIDDEVVLSTWNYSYSSFKYNREFFLSIKNSELLDVLEKIFLADFEWLKEKFYHSNLVLSPFYSREKFEYLLKNAKNSIKIYSLNFWDDNIEKILIQKAKSWTNIEMIFPSLSKVESNSWVIEKFSSSWIKIKEIKKPEIHAKAILVDDKYLYIWSVNFSYYSIDKNREIWLLLSNQEIIKKFLEIFTKDFE